MTTDSRFPKLRNLMGSYFHQHWKEDYDWEDDEPNIEAVVRFYKTNNPLSTVAQATEELKQFLALQLSEGDLKEALASIGVFYRPQANELTRQQWLESILSILSDPNSSPSTLRFVG